MNIGILTADSNGGFPIPATKGGAVPTLIESLIAENSKQDIAKLTVFSYYDEQAYESSKKYYNVRFIWIKIPKYIRKLDKTFYKIIKRNPNIKAISYKSVFSLLYYIRHVSKYLKEYHFDKLVLENNIPISWIIKLSHYSGPFYYHLHNVPRMNAKCEDVLKKCTGYLCVSKYVAKKIESPDNAIGPIKSEKVRIFYNAIDTDIFRPYTSQVKEKIKRNIEKRYGINHKDKIILFTGRISREKGLDLLLDALAKTNYSNYKLLIVGSVMHGSNDNDEYVNLVRHKAEKISSHVIFTGYIAHDELPEYYNAADLVVLPSMWEEPAGLTMIEAISCGANVITTNSGGIPEYVSKYAVILDKEKNIVLEMAKAIVNNLNNIPVDRQQMHTYIKSNFSTHDYMERFVRQLEK